MLDSKWIPVLLVLGWSLVTLGIWGAAGGLWWIWPLSGGALSLAAGWLNGWAAILQIRHAEASKGQPQQTAGAAPR